VPGETPYRVATTPPAPEPPDVERRLGVLRSTHLPPPLRRALGVAVAIGAMMAFGVAVAPGGAPPIFAVVFPFALAVTTLFTLTPLRRRHLRVELHAGGVSVRDGKKRTVVLFEDVDEVWLVLEPVKVLFGTIAKITALRLVDHAGASHRVPADLQCGEQIAEWVLRQCSSPLVPEALRALRAGETLTFGDVRLDRSGIRGRSWGAAWDELRLVRYAPGRVTLFRRQTVLAYRSILLDRVPHPTVFARLVTECAKKVDVDDPLGTLRT
jgi:hypothetical protein